ncbi:MAG: NAD(P)H-dependent glycerol-3-phosphate dehydrogenase [Calditrichaeota bacterium]|nr:MAG: NAD(P)H-dependent glycerol-3-phosphate dehydrogenase [Calditrichota bacterium]
MASIGIIGSGSWGTALAFILLQNGHQVVLYGRRKAQVDEIQKTHYNLKYLPGIRLPESLVATADLGEAIAQKDLVVMAVPSHTYRKVASQVAEVVGKHNISIVSVTKGIENDTLMRMEEVTQEIFAGREYEFICLSGPSHAEEVARNIPTAIVAASRNLASAQKVQKIFMSPVFRVYAHHDVAGVELGGALKNVIALAAGICDGVGFGDNTKAALMTRGLVEITRLGVAMGAEALTFAGLSGMGDLIVTCMSRYSRNRYVGEQIGKGKSLHQILNEMVMVAEGIRTTKSAHALAQKHGIEMPITEKVYQVLFKNEIPRHAVADLMTREAKVEKWG